MTYDAARQRTVIFGGTNNGEPYNYAPLGTALWDGSHWDVRTPANSPSPRDVPSMCYDSTRPVVLLYGGGLDNTPARDTWTWDGTNWSQVGSSGPNLVQSAAMAFDSARSVAVLCGRANDSSAVQTWEWNGAQWTLSASSGIPSPDANSMVYDANRGVCVLFCPDGSTREWNGFGWTTRATTGPSPRTGTRLVFDSARGVTVLFGGQTTNALGDTWEWDGNTWVQRATNGPNKRAWHGMAYDSVRQRTVLFGGYRQSASTPASLLVSDLWEWDGTNWMRRTDGIPEATRMAHSAFDSARGVTVLMRPATDAESGSPRLMQTWEWDGDFWHRRFTSSAPESTTDFCVTYDPVRASTLLLRGSDSKLWAYDGINWTMLHDGRSTSHPESAALMVFDLARSVAFTSANGWWEWDGSAWSRRSTSVLSTGYSCMGFDAQRGVSVLYGWGGALLGNTYEWDGTNWLFRTQGGPSASKECRLVFDSERGVCTLFGGWSPPLRFWNETWEWDGTSWTARAHTGPSPRGQVAMSYDHIRDRKLLFGGWGSTENRGDTWEWDGTAPAEVRTAPLPRFTASGGTARFSIATFGSDPISFQWRRDGAPLTDGPTSTGSVISGATSSMVSIAGVGTADEGQYDVIVSNACGEQASAAATLTITGCAGDLDGNQLVDLVDLARLLTQFGCSSTDASCTADLDADNAVGLTDLAILLTSFGLSCP